MKLPNLNIDKSLSILRTIVDNTVSVNNYTNGQYNIRIDLNKITGNLGSYIKIIDYLYGSLHSAFTNQPKSILLKNKVNSKGYFVLTTIFDDIKEEMLHVFPNYMMTFSRGSADSYMFMYVYVKYISQQEIIEFTNEFNLIMESVYSSLFEKLRLIQSREEPILSKKVEILDDNNVQLLSVNLDFFDEDVVKSNFVLDYNLFNQETLNDFENKMNERLVEFNNLYKDAYRKMEDFNHIMYHSNLLTFLNNNFDNTLFKESHPIFTLTDENPSFLIENNVNVNGCSIVGTGNISSERLVEIAKKSIVQKKQVEFASFVANLKTI
jgi:hypothetical protein